VIQVEGKKRYWFLLARLGLSVLSSQLVLLTWLHLDVHSCVHLGLHDCVQKTLVDVLRELIRSVFAELHLGVHGWLCCQGFTWVLAAVLFTRVSWVFTATHRLYVMCLPLLSQACI